MPDEEIRTLRNHQDFPFAEDVCDFLRQFGPGEYCGCLYLFAPKDLLEGQTRFQSLYSEAPPFECGESALLPEEILKATWIARTLDGDEIIYSSVTKTGYYVLPHESETVLKIGNTLAEVLDWFSQSGVMYERSAVKWFCTFKDRCRLHLARDLPISHIEMSNLVEEAFAVTERQVDTQEDFSIFFCREISGYIQIYANDIDIHHDLDFDAHVCNAAKEKFSLQGFRSVERHLPTERS